MQNNSASPSTPTDNTLPVKRVGRFYLSEKIGTGSNGSVYLGHDPVIDRSVAIKILSPSISAVDKRQREQQFINEARAAGRLSHPNIITIFDASSEGGTTFIAMEFLQGNDLRVLLSEGKNFDIIETANIIQKISDALAYAHEHGVIHRDIKPGNIFILPNQQPKVVDFGIARAPNRLPDPMSDQGVTLFNNNIMGTPNYMSPEQATGQPVTALTDVYSLGAVMYEMLTKQKPFQAQDINKLLHLIATKNPKPIPDINPNIPVSLTKIVMRAMQKNPADRYQSAAEMSADISKFLERDKKLKRKRGKSNSSHGTSEAQTQGEPTSWISWAAVIIATVAIFLYLIR